MSCPHGHVPPCTACERSKYINELRQEAEEAFARGKQEGRAEVAEWVRKNVLHGEHYALLIERDSATRAETPECHSGPLGPCDLHPAGTGEAERPASMVDELEAYASTWEPDVRLLGNVRADTIVEICRSYRDNEDALYAIATRLGVDTESIGAGISRLEDRIAELEAQLAEARGLICCAEYAEGGEHESDCAFTERDQLRSQLSHPEAGGELP